MNFSDKLAYPSPTSCVGQRIKKIRMEKGITRAELAEKLGFDPNRVQQYENGARKPKAQLLKKIAEALSVSIFALMDPVPISNIGVMHTFFELEENFNMTVERGPDDKEKAPTMTLSVSSADPIYYYMQEWLDEYEKIKSQLESASSVDEKETIVKAYHEWKWNYSLSNSAYEKTMQKARLKNEIEKLQKEYDSLCDIDET